MPQSSDYLDRNVPAAFSPHLYSHIPAFVLSRWESEGLHQLLAPRERMRSTHIHPRHKTPHRKELWTRVTREARWKTRMQKGLQQKINLVSNTAVHDNMQAYTIIERLSKDWKSPIYAFYKPIPEVTNVKGRRCHEFVCMARGCKYRSRRYIDTKDKSSTGNLIKHARSCWGDEAWSAANSCKNAAEARETVTKSIMKSGSITASFKRSGEGKISYSHRMHTKTETK
jgi:hypothetical protein